MSDSTVPSFHGNISFNAQHSPMGAFFSFTCGQFGSRGGFGLQIGKPGNQNLYIGVKDGDRFSDSPLKCLPFYEGAESDAAAAFQVEQADAASARPKITSYGRDEIKRHYGWATDRWVTKDFQLAIYTPFSPISDPAVQNGLWMKSTVHPAIGAEMMIDNRNGAIPRTAVFAIRFPDGGARVFEGAYVGFAWRSSMGVVASVLDMDKPTFSTESRPFVVQRWDLPEAIRNSQHVHHLGNTPGIAIEVPPGKCYQLRLVLGSYAEGAVTTRLEGRYYYTRQLSDLTDVLHGALVNWQDFKNDSADIEAVIGKFNLSPDQQFMIAHATRSYYGSTQLLDVGGQPYWVVNEGEYCMLNTLDLSVDHVFWELKQNPWVVKNLLDNFVRHYSYVDQVKDPKTGKLSEGGISFTHDQGVHNNFSPFGHSSYELPNLNALCFSYMTAEQLCNWILIAASYVSKTGDLEWARYNEHVIDACLHSLVNRTDQHGFPAYDSSRCGPDGAEITTYDSLDHSLAQTRNNLYMVVKTWAAYRGLALVYERMGHQHEYHDAAVDMAERIEAELPKRAGADGVFPAVFEEDNAGYTSRILPAAEGLIYPLYWGTLKSSPFVEALKKHTLTLLKSGTNIFPDGGIKLSSTSNNSWMSKIAIFMHVCRKVFKVDEDPQIKELFAKADAAHVKWQTEGESAYWACSDQFVSGVAKGSKYYPRIITAALWMEE